MTDCPNGTLRETLPDYVHGTLSAHEAAAVDAHLDGCADCRAEVELLKSVRLLVGRATPAIDHAAIAAAVATAVPSARRRRLTMSPRYWSYAAAAALLLAVGTRGVWTSGRAMVEPRTADTVVASRTPVSDTPAVTAETPTPRPVEVGVSFGGGLSDLSVEELQKLLVQMDSVRTVPSLDPEAMTPVVSMKEGGKSL